MVQEIHGYKFEVDKDGNEFPDSANSLSSALKKMYAGTSLIANYDVVIDGRTLVDQQETLEYEEINQLSEQQIIDLIGQRVRSKHNK